MVIAFFLKGNHRTVIKYTEEWKIKVEFKTTFLANFQRDRVFSPSALHRSKMTGSSHSRQQPGTIPWYRLVRRQICFDQHQWNHRWTL